MSDLIFLFDLDSTITREEILPTIASKINKADEMRELTDKTMHGELPFKQSFLRRTEILKEMPVSVVRNIIENIPLNEKLLNFIQSNKNRCYIVTGNLDVWIDGLMQKISMEKNYFSSKALATGDELKKVVSVIDKNAVISQFIAPYVAVGDGNNDAEMIENAEIGIGYGGVRNVAPAILECATHVVYKEDTLCQFLERLL